MGVDSCCAAMTLCAYAAHANIRLIRSSMDISTDQRRLLALCAIRIQDKSVDWSLIARLASFVEGLDALWQADIREKSPAATASQPILRKGLASPNELFARVDSELT